MKWFLCFCCLVIVGSTFVLAHPYAPPSAYLAGSDSIYLTKVSSVDGEKITFSVTETVKGTPFPSLTLIPAPGFEFHKDTEWMLIHTGSNNWKDHVGSLISGDCEWVPTALIRKGDLAYIQTPAFPESGIALDTLPDGSKGLTLDHVKDLLKKSPAKN